MLSVVIAVLTAVGLFFCGIWFLATNLTLAAGPSARGLFRRAFGSNWSAALTGMITGLLTPSTNAVALIVVSFVRAGIVNSGRAPLVPVWSNVGASALVFLVALDTSYIVACVLALCGISLYFDFRITDQLRHVVLALMGTAMLLLGLGMLSDVSLPLRDLFARYDILGTDSNVLLTLGIGVLLVWLVQSSTVVGSFAVALISVGVLDLDTALLLLLAANLGSGLNYAFLARSGEATGRHILFFITLQKLAGSLLLLVPMLLAPDWLVRLLGTLPVDTAYQMAVAFLATQIVGSLVCTLASAPLHRWLQRLVPPRREDQLAKPAFLVEEAVEDPSLALELAEREVQRLSQRLPSMLEGLRVDGDPRALPPNVYCKASVTVGATVRQYLTSILDRKPDHAAIVRAMNLQQNVNNCVALHETLNEFVQEANVASGVPAARETVSRMIESLHMLLQQLVEASISDDPREHDMTLALLGQRGELMEGIRKRLLAGGPGMETRVQEALFRTTILFERTLWLAKDSLLTVLRDRGEHLQTAR